jgi:hypothetical protein
MKFRPVFSFHVRVSVSVSAPFGVRDGLGVLRGQYQASANLAPYAQILSLMAVLKCRMMLEKLGLRRLPQSLRSHGLLSDNAIPMIPKRSAFSTKTRLVQCLHRCPHNRQAGQRLPEYPRGLRDHELLVMNSVRPHKLKPCPPLILRNILMSDGIMAQEPFAYARMESTGPFLASREDAGW